MKKKLIELVEIEDVSAYLDKPYKKPPFKGKTIIFIMCSITSAFLLVFTILSLVNFFV